MKPDPHDRHVTFRDLEHVTSAAVKAALADGRKDAFSTLDDLLTAVCDAAGGTYASPSPRAPMFIRIARAARRVGLNLNWIGDPAEAMRRGESLRLASSPRPAPEADSELLGLYREWRALKSELDDLSSNMESALWKNGEKRLWKVEKLIAASRPGTLKGLAAMIVVADDGDFWGDPNQKLLVEYALAVLEDPTI